MDYTDGRDFCHYYRRIHHRTRRLLDLMPPSQTEWRPAEGRFSIGDLFRHIAASKRYMFAENAAFRPSRYSGCGPELARNYDEIVTFFDRMHDESWEIILPLSQEDLLKKTTVPSGHQITLWKWLRSMVEHEVHHRGQIYLYLGLMEINTPPIFGMTSEEVARASSKNT